jgi:hypothetical protein
MWSRRPIRMMVIAGSSWLAAGSAMAHPGHGAATGSTSLAHYLSEPVHVAPLLLAIAAAFALARWRTRRAVHAREVRK